MANGEVFQNGFGIGGGDEGLVFFEVTYQGAAAGAVQFAKDVVQQQDRLLVVDLFQHS